jgi:hypothetical protein
MAATQRQYKERDFVVDLLTGKMVTKTDRKTGRTTTEFVAVRPNQYPPISVIAAAYPEVSLDDILINESLRLRRIDLDPTIRVKDAVEKEDLKFHKQAHKAHLHSLGVDPKKQMNA